LLRFVKEVWNGKAQRRRPVVVKGLDYDVFEV